MKLSVLFIICLPVWMNIANGQTVKPQIIVNSYPQSRICAYSENRLPADIIGAFNSDNKFTVELMKPYTSQVIASYEATYTDGAFHFRVEEDILLEGTAVSYGVSSSSPVVKTGGSYITQFFNRGTLRIGNASGTADTLNAGTNLLLSFNATANNLITATLSDSSKVYIHGPNATYPMSIPVSESKDLFIVKALNGCDISVPSSGKALVAVNAVSIIPGKVNNTAVCDDGEIELTYSTSGGVIPATAHFKLRFLKMSYSHPDENRIVEIPAVKKQEGILTGKIPKQMIRYSLPYQVAIVVDIPGLVSPYSEQFSIHEKPVATFRYQNDSARIGEAYNLYFNVSGPAPYTLELSNGTSYLLDGNLLAKIYPLNTETFEIRSLKTRCGVTTDLPKQKVVISVPPGIAILPPAAAGRSICENQVMRLPFVSNVPLNSNTQLIVEGRTQSNKIYQFEAKLVNDSIEFLIPHSPAGWGEEGYFNIYSFRIKTVNPSYTSEYIHGFTVRGIPRISYDTYESASLPYPGYLSYNLVVSGGVPFTVIDYKGGKSYADHMRKFERVYVPESGNFAPQSVENECYSTSGIPRLELTVDQYTDVKPVVVVHPPAAKYLCSPDSIEISFEALGRFEADNEFQIFLPGSTTEVWKTVKTPGVYKMPAALLGERSYLYQSIRSTKPEEVWSAGIPYLIDEKPKKLSQEEIYGITADSPRIFGIDETPFISVPYGHHAPYTAVFSDGTQDYHFVQRSQYATFPPPMERSKVTPFLIKSMTNVCGTTALNLTTYLYWRQHRITLRGFTEGQVYCAGEEIVVPFAIENGTAPPGTVFRLQITKDHEEYHTLATTTTSGNFRYKIPEAFEEGQYYISVTTDEFTSSGGTRLVVQKKPTATLTVSGPNGVNPGEIAFGEELKLEYLLTGGGPWQLLHDGRGESEIFQAYFYQTTVIGRETLFKSTSISNSCGYGTVSGEFLVKVKPKVVSVKPQSATVCSGSTLRVDYAIGGDIPSGEKVGFYLTNSNGTRSELLSVTAADGTASLLIADHLLSGNYALTCYVTGTDASLSEQIRIQKAPEIELIGHTTINPGESTYINIWPKEEGDQEVLIQLSDGTNKRVRFSYPFFYSIAVTPSTTTTYTITSATSNCGPVQYSGSVTVVVNPAAGRTVRVIGTNKENGSFCSGDTLLVYFNQTGAFSSDNSFTLQLFDKQGQMAKTFASGGKESPLQVVIQDDLVVGESYRFRVIASEANTASSDYQQPLRFAANAGISFAEANLYKDDTGKASVVVLLEGTGPWRYAYGNDLGAVMRYAEISPDTLVIESKEPSAYFRLNSVTNSCGTGKINEPSAVRIEVILGLEDVDSEIIAAGPNPTSQDVVIHFAADAERNLTLLNSNGVVLWHHTSVGSRAKVDMTPYPPGVYLLKIMLRDKMKTLKVVKH